MSIAGTKPTARTSTRPRMKFLRRAVALASLGACAMVGVPGPAYAKTLNNNCMYNANGVPGHKLACYGTTKAVYAGRTYSFFHAATGVKHRYRVYSATNYNTAGWFDGRYMICSLTRWSGQCYFI